MGHAADDVDPDRHVAGSSTGVQSQARTPGQGRYGTQALARTTFMVEAGGARARPPTARPGLRVSAFYPVSKASLDAWNSGTATMPPPFTTYASGSTDITFYVAYQGAVPGETTLQVILRKLAPPVSVPGPVDTVALPAGRWMMHFTNTPDPFPDGAYRGDVLINGQVVASARLTVGAPAP